MSASSGLPRWLGPVLFAAGLAALYAGALGTPFLNDDYLFLEQARTRPLAESLTRLDPLGNYYRPLSRQLLFAVAGSAGGGDPRIFHAFDFAVFLAALALLADLLAVFAAGLPLLAGLLFFALLPLQRVNLLWISCAQDLLALAFTLAAVALWRRERRGAALAAWVLALASKESALPLPLVLAGWDIAVGRRDAQQAFRRQVPMALAGLAWGALVLAVRARSHPTTALDWAPGNLAATVAHFAQTLLGIEHPAGFLAGFASGFPSPIALLLLALAGLAIATRPAGEPAAPGRPDALRFALLWMGAFLLVTWPVVPIWSGYFYTLPAAGAALLVARLAGRIGRAGWVLLTAALLWWHAAGTSSPAFAVADGAWGWTSHLTTGYFTRGAALTTRLGRSLRVLEPAPPHGTRFFFATLPPWAGFQMGNGAQIRALYRDPTLESWFYSQFGDSTAGDRECRFLWWDGAEIRPLYPGLANPFFQVGCDLLLLDRPRGAAHAFRRSRAAGGQREDDLYWLGWALLWSGERDNAETAWRLAGARDDAAVWRQRFEAVRTVLYEQRDTLAARRLLLEAIRAGIGQPHTHAILGELLLARGGTDAKYGMLELKVAGWLNPKDLLARRELVEALASIHMDDQALAELESMKRLDAGWRADTALVALDRRLRERRPAAGGVATFR